jgi:flavodoxin I
MKILIIYDSVFGNTEKIAISIAKVLSKKHLVEALKITVITEKELSNAALVIIGSPTRGFKATKPINEFIAGLSANTLDGINVCVFDTRIRAEKIKQSLFRYIVKKGGYAAEKITKMLKKKNLKIIFPPEAFYVLDSEGPLEQGEIERAENWADSIMQII